MKVWASEKSIRAEIADVPQNWLHTFAARKPECIRKLGDARNSTLLFHVESVLSSIEMGEIVRNSKEG